MALEPLYSLDVACELIPCSKITLEHFLSRKADQFDQPLWHTMYNAGKAASRAIPAIRMLRESECLKIRNMIIKPGGPRGAGIVRDHSVVKSPQAHFLEVQIG